MAGSIFDWSKIPGDNDTADPDINYQENQVPSTMNNSARQAMARVAELLDDLGAVTSTTNLSNAYTLTANSAFTALADGLIVGFKASATNTGAATLNVNALGSKAIRRIGASADVAIEAGTIVSGQKYLAIYDSAANAAAGAWMLLNPLMVSLSVANTTGAIGVATGSLANLEVKSDGAAGNAAFMAFHRQGTHAGYFGIDTDNKFKVGGWSFGANAYDVYHAGNPEIPSGTRMVFYQAAAPTGWTKVTGIDNRAMRVVDGAGGGSGGSVGFTTVFGRTATDGHALTTAELSSHTHTGTASLQSNNHQHGGGTVAYRAVVAGADFNALVLPGTVFSTAYALPTTGGINANHNHTFTSDATGSGNSHAHNIDLRVTYIDVICCSRN